MAMLLNPRAKYTHQNLSIITLAKMQHEHIFVQSLWQRSRRWKEQDAVNYITAVLRNVPTPTVFLARIPTDERTKGGAHYYIVDGQNRLAAMESFLVAKTISVKVGDVFAGMEGVTTTMKIDQFNTAQQQQIMQVQIPVCIFSDGVTDAELQEVFRNLNKCKPITAAERIHSWVHLSLVTDVLNPLDRQYRDVLHRLRPRWRAMHHGLVVLFARLVALTDGVNAVFLNSTLAVETWVSRTHMRQFSPEHYRRIEEFIHTIVKLFTSEGSDLGMPAFLDLGWVMHAFDMSPAQNEMDWSNLVQFYHFIVHNKIVNDACCNTPDADVWRSSSTASLYAALMRRKQAVQYLATELGLQPINGLHLLVHDNIPEDKPGASSNDNDNNNNNNNNNNEEDDTWLCDDSD